MQRRGMNVRKGLLRAILPLLRVLPPRSATRLLAGIGRAEYALMPRLRLRLDGAIAREATDAAETPRRCLLEANRETAAEPAPG
jgi:hypothetical protein